MIKRIKYSAAAKKDTLALIDRINKSSEEIPAAVDEIIGQVAKKGDLALKELSLKLDGVAPAAFRVPAALIKKSYSSLDRKLKKAMETALSHIRAYHRLQRKSIKDYTYKNRGYTVRHKYIPVNSAGIYIPGGQAPLFSTVFMAAVPAVEAGVKRIVIVSPPRCKGEVNPYILAAAYMAGVSEIYRVGGAQAVAALALGTQSITKVDKVAGPGNIYSTMAKRRLFGKIGIDAISGPSEITIIADKTAAPLFIYYDLMAQAEHTGGHSLLITDSKAVADAVEALFIRHKTGSTADVTIITVKNMKEAVMLAEYKAPEHLAVFAKNSGSIIKQITNSPAIFEGNYSPVAFGDYMAGSNHILPTNGTARFFSALSVLDFMKHTHIVKCSKAAIETFGPDAELMAGTETLNNHMMSIRVRRQK